MSSAVAAALAAEVFGRAVATRPIDSGGDHHSWWIGDHHVLRWAPDRTTSRRLDREIVLRRWLRRHLRSPVPDAVTDGTWHGRRWVLDERLAGQGLEEGPIHDRTCADLVELLADLRRCPIEEMAAIGLPRLSTPDLHELAAEGLAAHRALGIARHLTPPCDVGVVAREELGQVVLVHADLKGEHLLIDDTGHLTGVLDWSDAGTGDASLDVEGLVVAIGASNAAQVAARASVPADVIEQGIFLARCRTALRLDALVNRGEPSGPKQLLRHQHDLAWN